MSSGALYRSGEEVLAGGLSKASRIILGCAVGLMGVGVALNASNAPNPTLTWIFAGFCMAVALMCVFNGRLRRAIGRIVAATIFVTCVWYVIDCAYTEPVSSGSRSQPSLMNAVLLMLFAGIPAAYFAIRGRFRDRAYPQADDQFEWHHDDEFASDDARIEAMEELERREAAKRA